MINIVAEIAEGINELHTKPMELAAIGLPSKVKANDKLTHRIEVGDLVTVKDGKLVNEGDNTHVITTCWGCLYSKFSISVIDLKTMELSKIKL